jgi:hypothetical protein
VDRYIVTYSYRRDRTRYVDQTIVLAPGPTQARATAKLSVPRRNRLDYRVERVTKYRDRGLPDWLGDMKHPWDD